MMTQPLLRCSNLRLRTMPRVVCKSVTSALRWCVCQCLLLLLLLPIHPAAQCQSRSPPSCAPTARLPPRPSHVAIAPPASRVDLGCRVEPSAAHTQTWPNAPGCGHDCAQHSVLLLMEWTHFAQFFLLCEAGRMCPAPMLAARLASMHAALT